MGGNWCCHCGYMLPFGRKNARKCGECNITCHANCAHLVPDFCGMSMETANELLRNVREINRGRANRQQREARQPEPAQVHTPSSSIDGATSQMGQLKLIGGPAQVRPDPFARAGSSPPTEQYQLPPIPQQPLQIPQQSQAPAYGQTPPGRPPPGARPAGQPGYSEQPTGRPSGSYDVGASPQSQMDSGYGYQVRPSHLAPRILLMKT